MKLEENIEETATRICDAIAGAIELYASISGDPPGELPESFVSAYVFASLGPVLTMTMETNSSKLWEWSCDMRRRWRGLPTGQPTPAVPPEFVPTVGMRRADLVLYKGDHTKKNETDFLCLVEFKTWGSIDSDAKKIREWFQFIDTCPWGLACGFADITATNQIEIIRKEADVAGDKLVMGRVARPSSGTRNLLTFARILTNVSYRACEANSLSQC
ncbi:MAG: hypothetical protein ACR650_01095 [Methylocystis sp.]